MKDGKPQLRGDFLALDDVDREAAASSLLILDLHVGCEACIDSEQAFNNL
jgi:hypothetical protein